MDTETKQYLEAKLAEILETLNEGFSRLEKRPEPDRPEKASDLADGVVSLEERLRTLDLRMQQLETRETNRTEELRRGLRALNDRATAFERRLSAQERMIDRSRRGVPLR
jgi:predicted ribosome quality control (RQC) complex YloA/Tae2 family protein